MSDRYKCPNCDTVPGGFGVSHADLKRCNDCQTEFCHKCPGSNDGRCCPKCRSSSFSTVGKIWAKH